MSASLKMQAAEVIPSIRNFLSAPQLLVMADGCRGEEKEFYMQKFIDLARLIDTMPKTYEQDGKGDAATVYLHYFLGGFDWYITEKDKDGGTPQAYGFAFVHGDGELGYISIDEIVKHGAELDLHFKPCSLGEIKLKAYGLASHS